MRRWCARRGPNQHQHQHQHRHQRQRRLRLPPPEPALLPRRGPRPRLPAALRRSLPPRAGRWCGLLQHPQPWQVRARKTLSRAKHPRHHRALHPCLPRFPALRLQPQQVSQQKPLFRRRKVPDPGYGLPELRWESPRWAVQFGSGGGVRAKSWPKTNGPMTSPKRRLPKSPWLPSLRPPQRRQYRSRCL